VHIGPQRAALDADELNRVHKTPDAELSQCRAPFVPEEYRRLDPVQFVDQPRTE
jgi:hypothetical protein